MDGRAREGRAVNTAAAEGSAYRIVIPSYVPSFHSQFHVLHRLCRKDPNFNLPLHFERKEPCGVCLFNMQSAEIAILRTNTLRQA